MTELKALLGCVGETRFVMGCISQLQDGRYFLEDLSDALPIDLSEAQTTSGFFTGGRSSQPWLCTAVKAVLPTVQKIKLPDLDHPRCVGRQGKCVERGRHADMPGSRSGRERPCQATQAMQRGHACTAENCIVVAEGVLQHSGTFKVRALGFPPVELRGESRAAAKVSCFACCVATCVI